MGGGSRFETKSLLCFDLFWCWCETQQKACAFELKDFRRNHQTIAAHDDGAVSLRLHNVSRGPRRSPSSGGHKQCQSRQPRTKSVVVVAPVVLWDVLCFLRSARGFEAPAGLVDAD